MPEELGMAQAERVYRCDECTRVVAVADEDGNLTLRVRHDREFHETKIVGRPEGSREKRA